MHALRCLVPEWDFRVIHERPWHSLTFSGCQICISVGFDDPGNSDQQDQLSRLLTEFEFELPKQIVADIAVTEATAKPGLYGLIIDALLLDD